MIKKCVKDNLLYLIILCIIIVTLFLIMKSSFYGDIISFDNKVIDFMKSKMNVNTTAFFKIITNFGDWYIPVLIIVCIFFSFKNKKCFYLVSSCYGLAGLTVLITKLIVRRPRPLEAIITIPKSFSFPSGHTLTSIIFYILLWLIITNNSKKSLKIITLILLIIFISMIGISRIYLGVHYFSDVIGGIILSFPILLIVINISKKVMRC